VWVWTCWGLQRIHKNHFSISKTQLLLILSANQRPQHWACLRVSANHTLTSVTLRNMSRGQMNGCEWDIVCLTHTHTHTHTEREPEWGTEEHWELNTGQLMISLLNWLEPYVDSVVWLQVRSSPSAANYKLITSGRVSCLWGDAHTPGFSRRQRLRLLEMMMQTATLALWLAVISHDAGTALTCRSICFVTTPGLRFPPHVLRPGQTWVLVSSARVTEQNMTRNDFVPDRSPPLSPTHLPPTDDAERLSSEVSLRFLPRLPWQQQVSLSNCTGALLTVWQHNTSHLTNIQHVWSEQDSLRFHLIRTLVPDQPEFSWR